ncbi:MAG: hypothetical protein ACEPO2_07180 [Pelagibaca sp.]
MMKYLVGLGALAVVTLGYFLLVPSVDAPAPMPESAVRAPDAAAPAPVTDQANRGPVAPIVIAAENVASALEDEEAALEDMALKAREGLPSAVTNTLTLEDAFFLPRMRIMEFSYVTTAPDGRAVADEMRTLIEARSEGICLEGRQMFEMDVTLRNSFEDRDGTLFQRVYLLPEDCQEFY